MGVTLPPLSRVKVQTGCFVLPPSREGLAAPSAECAGRNLTAGSRDLMKRGKAGHYSPLTLLLAPPHCQRGLLGCAPFKETEAETCRSPTPPCGSAVEKEPACPVHPPVCPASPNTAPSLHARCQGLLTEVWQGPSFPCWVHLFEII